MDKILTTLLYLLCNFFLKMSILGKCNSEHTPGYGTTTVAVLEVCWCLERNRDK